MALVQESVRRLGGHVDVTSKVGEGSTFTVSIPPLAPTEGAATQVTTPTRL